MNGYPALINLINLFVICSVYVNSQYVPSVRENLSQGDAARLLSLNKVLPLDNQLSSSLQGDQLINDDLYFSKSPGVIPQEFHRADDVRQALNFTCPGVAHTVHTPEPDQGKRFLAWPKRG
ncbi:hypothetical protein RRG08_004829 [Elysia crispata]|uniref:Uncharacterized protein n=1 Tax=Elysia crispata TaxID=231223 RepID=A0AAE0Y5Y0_9GAST|nr:hypothetical protein RRG08_004829 [Elysia crispata]